MPFVVGGFAAMIYCIDWNNRGYQRFKKAYRLLSDYEKNPDAYPDGPTDEFHGRYSADFIRNLRNNYRRNRDLCIIISAGLYVLQIVDAHVDAHLKDYDVSDDLSMNLEPLVDYTYVPSRRRQPCGIRVQPEFQILTDENPPDHSAADGRRCARIGPRPQTPQEREEKARTEAVAEPAPAPVPPAAKPAHTERKPNLPRRPPHRSRITT